MSNLLQQFFSEVHWPSWLRGFAIAYLTFGLFYRDWFFGLIGILLYVGSQFLIQRFPHKQTD